MPPSSVPVLLYQYFPVLRHPSSRSRSIAAGTQIQAHAQCDLPLHPSPLESLSGQLARLPRPYIAAHPALHERVLQRQHRGLDTALLTHHVVQLPSNHRRRSQHVVDGRDVVALCAGVRGRDGGVGGRERRLQEGDVGREGGFQGRQVRQFLAEIVLRLVQGRCL